MCGKVSCARTINTFSILKFQNKTFDIFIFLFCFDKLVVKCFPVCLTGKMIFFRFVGNYVALIKLIKSCYIQLFAFAKNKFWLIEDWPNISIYFRCLFYFLNIFSSCFQWRNFAEIRHLSVLLLKILLMEESINISIINRPTKFSTTL